VLPDISPLVGEMSGRTEGGAKERDDKPIVRQRSGIGSYEDPADERRQKRRPSKTGRPGH
ncbi:MAG: hypothetical protein E5X28_04475, partial [Mesorhizobium sp.]